MRIHVTRAAIPGDVGCFFDEQPGSLVVWLDQDIYSEAAAEQLQKLFESTAS
ncbi:hypothetical protein GCM10010406_21770 [Streptomyces thermolineatus]|uniref:Uncharacterized protein n=1 Tax=Streptomyces thermolineatus TaxID=44033 RepID=A0ABP5YV99_9ACTN